MENNLKENNEDKALISITASENAIGVIEYLDQSVSFSLNSGEVFTHEILTTVRDIIHRSSGVVRDKGVRISSSGSIAVHAFNLRSTSSDGSVILPVSALGLDYLVTSHFNDLSLSENNFESTLLVVAIADQTTLEIIPTATTTNGFAPGNSYQVTLDEGQSYQLKGLGDLTGTRVRVVNANGDNCKRIAVFGGNKMTQSGVCGTTADHLFQQTYPLFTWGTSFTHIPLLDRTAGELVKVLASENGTEITLNGNRILTLNEGEFYTFDFNGIDIQLIEGSKPIAATAISKSQDCDSNAEVRLGDPLMLTYNPDNHQVKSIVFNSLQSYGFNRHYINILVESEFFDLTRLNGISIADEFVPVPGKQEYMYARIQLNGGVNSLSNPEGLVAYAYGAGIRNSYGFSAGAIFEDSDFEVSSDYEFEVIGDRIACFGQEGTWEILPENPIYTQFEWNFGDGSEPVLGQVAIHQYLEEGEFTVSVYASNGESACPIEYVFDFDVVVDKVEFELVGESNVCPGAIETYTLGERKSNFESIEWQTIEGGEILEETDEYIIIQWGDALLTTTIGAYGYAPNGCKSELYSKEIIIGEQQIDIFPEGVNEVCKGSAIPDSYIVPLSIQNTGTVEWMVQGGEITKGQFDSEVFVLWDSEAVERTISFTLIAEDESCGKTSKALVVDMIDEVPFEDVVIAGEDEVCLGSEVRYTFTSSTSFIDVKWSLPSGGRIVEQDGNSVLIRWEEHTSEMGLGVTPITDSGCEGREYFKRISLKEVALLPVASGNFLLCGPEFFDQEYTIPQVDSNYQYTWEVEGGEILGNATGETISVKWEPSVSERWISYTQLPINAEECQTLSKRLLIEYLEPIQLIEKIEKIPSCASTADGALEVILSGGSGEFEYEWEGFPEEITSLLSGIEAGEYKLKVKDKAGCGFGEFILSLEEAESIQLTGDLEILPTSCVGTGDGGFSTLVRGGMPPYQVMGLESFWDGEKLTVSGLSKGPFSLFIEDSKGCSIPIEGVINGPEELQVSFVQMNESCPGGNFGRLEVNVSGGVKPYTYSWDQGLEIASLSASSASSFGTNSISNMPSGDYQVSITDANGCQVTAYGKIMETSPQVRMPTGFLPKDGVYSPVSNCSLDFTMRIFDRWGNLIFEGKKGWDGFISGKEAPIGTYTYAVSYTFNNENQTVMEEKSGVFTLIR